METPPTKANHDNERNHHPNARSFANICERRFLRVDLIRGAKRAPPEAAEAAELNLKMDAAAPYRRIADFLV